MNGNRNRDLEIFTEAIQLPEEERAAFLDRIGAEDGELRGRIEALLRSNARAGSFLEEALASSLGERRSKMVIGESPGNWIGRYKLIRQIGEGGCGVVFVAEQEEPVRRRVALKVIKPGMDTKSVIARFEAERQALALMDHPSIARVFDAGATDQGRPFFVMELVEGVKISDYCAQHSLPLDGRLGLFVQVCEAVQHAHQKGIIHRDIKPSNVLVTTGPDGKPRPKVIDFGIAKATGGQQLTEKTILSGPEMFLGTPAYMSPEQAALASTEVDTRTDIYSLGVLLYELLTGTTPFDTQELLKTGLDEVRRVIRDEQPVRPSTRLTTMLAANLVSDSKHHRAEAPRLIRAMRGELDWIVMKALEKDRTRRYATANGFAMDVERYRSGEAILARPPSGWYQLRKLAARNRLMFGALSTVATVIVVGFVAVTVALTREKTARNEADKARQQAEADKARSEQVTAFLGSMLEGVGPSVALGRDTVMLREIMEKTAARLGRQLTNQPAVQADLRTRLARMYRDLGEYAKSEAMLREALSIRTRLFGEESEAATDILFELGEVLSMQSREAEAEPCIRRALAVRQGFLGEKHLKVADCYFALGGLFWGRRQLPEAEAMLTKALVIQRELLGDDSHGLSDSLVGLASIRFEQGKYAEAERLFRQAMSNWEKVVGEDHPGVIRCVNNLATVLAVQDKGVEAEALMRRAVATRRKLHGGKHPAVAESLHNLTRLLIRLDRFAEAEVVGREALEVARNVWGDTPEETLTVLRDLIIALLRQRKSGELERLFADLLPPETEWKREHGRVLYERCGAYARCGRWKEAAADAAILLKRSPDKPDNYYTLAPLLTQVGDMAGYQTLCRAMLDKFSGTTNTSVADRVSKACLIVPLPEVDSRAAALAGRAAGRGTNGSVASSGRFCQALAEFRLGHYKEALTWARPATESRTSHTKACAFAVMAMSRFKLNQVDAARNALADCSKVIEEKLPKIERGDLGLDWKDWIIAHALRSEAKRLIEGEPAPPAAPPH